MKTNAERIAKYITKHGSKSILIHTIPGTCYWIVCQKITTANWALILCDPMKNVTFNLGTINESNHINLWLELINLEIKRKINFIKTAKELRNKVNNFKKTYQREYRKFNKIIDNKCWAQVKEDWCRKETIRGSDYCQEHKKEFKILKINKRK